MSLFHSPLTGDALRNKGWFASNKWLILRRASQVSILGLFLTGPWLGIWIVKGNLNSSLTLDILPLSDPFVLLQTLVAGHLPETTAIIGAVIVAAFYAFVGGRVYCAWVCPVNFITDAAQWLRARLDLPKGWQPKRQTRFWIMAMALLVSLLTGGVAWEFINPVSMAHRGIIFGFGLAWLVLLAVFLFDLLVSRRGWCGHLCPVGAFYRLLGHKSLIRVSAAKRSACNDCMDCFAVCPEPQVITPALRGTAADSSPIIQQPDCTNCGRCIDVCGQDVFRFTHRFDQSETSHLQPVSPKQSNKKTRYSRQHAAYDQEGVAQ